MKKVNFKIILLCLISVGLFVLIAFGVYVYLESERWQKAGYQIEELNDRIERFEMEPNIDDCYFIVSRSVGLKKYVQTIYYGKKCICLGIDETPGGMLVHFWMAVSFYRLGDIELSKHHLSMALKLDKEDKIMKNKWIEKMEMESVYEELECIPKKTKKDNK